MTDPLAANVARVSICAEAVALSSAIMAEATGFDTIVALHRAPRDNDHFGWAPVSPRGMCRELLSDYAPGLRGLLPTDSGDLHGATIESLLPAKFCRPSTI